MAYFFSHLRQFFSIHTVKYMLRTMLGSSFPVRANTGCASIDDHPRGEAHRRHGRLPHPGALGPLRQRPLPREGALRQPHQDLDANLPKVICFVALL